MTELSGFVLIDKSEGPTSHAVVSCIRRVLKVDKAGHLGTLDPFASGLLPVMIGNASRLFDEVLEGEKGYLFTVSLGTETDTLDGTGRIVAEAPVPASAAVLAADVLPGFLGPIEQIPPVYSALKMNGRPLYEHMRATGKLPDDIASKRRTVTIHSLEIVGAVETKEASEVTFRVVCSKGTYVRSLARDLAKAMDTVGHCKALCRERVAPWDVKAALKLDLKNPPAPDVLLAAMRPAEEMIPDTDLWALPQCVQKALLAGNPFVLSIDAVQRLRPSAFAEPDKALVRLDATTFLADLIWPGSAHRHAPEPGAVRIQPRKKIS